MPTTLITTVQGIGLGVMGQALAERVRGITRVLGVRREPQVKIDLSFPERSNLSVWDWSIPPSQLGDSQKFIYIEQSYGSAKLLAGREKIYVPMWEQASTAAELPHATCVVAVTKHTRGQIPGSAYLPWPVDTDAARPRVVSRVRTILHNAGSLGANLRKGTLEAVKMFQLSNLVRDGVRLVVHAWRPPPAEVEALLAAAPDGITWTNRFLPRSDDVYSEYEPDLLLMPSKIEGHALVALEAMARGVPVMVTDSPPINEYEGDCSFLLPVSGYMPSPLRASYAIASVTAGAELLRAVRFSNMTEKSRRVREFVEREMSWKVLGPQWEELCA